MAYVDYIVGTGHGITFMTAMPGDTLFTETVPGIYYGNSKYGYLRDSLTDNIVKEDLQDTQEDYHDTEVYSSQSYKHLSYDTNSTYSGDTQEFKNNYIYNSITGARSGSNKDYSYFKENMAKRSYTTGRLANTWRDWRIVPSSRPAISPPEPNYKFVEVPGNSIKIDLSKYLTGFMTYQYRTGTLEFTVTGEKAPDYGVYIAQNNDTLENIATKLKCTTFELKTMNRMHRVSGLITSNEVLLFPKVSKYFVYTVQSGDTIEKISRKYGCSIYDLEAINNKLTTTAFQNYTVKNGDTLESIARKYESTVEELEEINPELKYTRAIPYTVKANDSIYHCTNVLNNWADMMSNSLYTWALHFQKLLNIEVTIPDGMTDQKQIKDRITLEVNAAYMNMVIYYNESTPVFGPVSSDTQANIPFFKGNVYENEVIKVPIKPHHLYTGQKLTIPKSRAYSASQEDQYNWADLYQRIMSTLHGKTMYAILDDDPDYFYKGTFKVSGWATDETYSTVSIAYELEPFKYYVRLSDQDWVWDPFDFESDRTDTILKNIEVKKNTDTTPKEISIYVGSVPTAVYVYTEDENSNAQVGVKDRRPSPYSEYPAYDGTLSNDSNKKSIMLKSEMSSKEPQLYLSPGRHTLQIYSTTKNITIGIRYRAGEL